MDDKIFEFIEKYIKLTEAEKTIIRNQNVILSYKKGTVLLAAGEVAKECYFVLEGCVRSYHFIDGEDRTTEFYTENSTINPVSYFSKEPSTYYLECLEDTILSLGSEERNQELLSKVPRLTEMVMKMSSSLISKQQVTFDDFKTMKPEQRYLHLLEHRPDLLQRVPLLHIATYLGITPVSLSRMRKRIATN